MLDEAAVIADSIVILVHAHEVQQVLVERDHAVVAAVEQPRSKAVADALRKLADQIEEEKGQSTRLKGSISPIRGLRHL